MPVFYWSTMLFMRLALLLLAGRWQVQGGHHVPHGALIVVANHLSFLDPPLLGASLPRRLVFMTKEELVRAPVFGVAVRAFGAFPVRRGAPDREALRFAFSVLEKGQALALFPEGTRNPRGELQRGHPGIALLALRAGVPILPVGICGTERVQKMSRVFSRPHILVNIGPPFKLPSPEGKIDRAQMVELSNIIMGHIASVLPEPYRGVYRDSMASAAAGAVRGGG